MVDLYAKSVKDEDLERFALEFCKHEELLKPVINSTNGRLLRAQAMVRLGAALGVASTKEMARQVARFKWLCIHRMRWLVRVAQARYGTGADALVIAPAWLRRLDRPLDLMINALKLESTEDAPFSWTLFLRVRAELRSATPRERPALLGRCDVFADLANSMRVPASRVHGIWSRMYDAALRRLRCSARHGDLRNPLRPTPLDWHVIDLALLYDPAQTALAQESFCSPLEVEALVQLYKLIADAHTQFDTEKPDGVTGTTPDEPAATTVQAQPGSRNDSAALASISPIRVYTDAAVALSRASGDAGGGAERREADWAAMWSAVHAKYTRRGRIASLVTLQRRWHELKLLARSELLVSFRDPGHKPHPLLLAIGKRFPVVVTRRLASWPVLVREGRVLTRDVDAEAPQPALLADVPSITSMTEVMSDLLDWSDDEPEIIEPKKVVIEVDSDAETDAGAGGSQQAAPALRTVKTEPTDHDYALRPLPNSETDDNNVSSHETVNSNEHRIKSERFNEGNGNRIPVIVNVITDDSVPQAEQLDSISAKEPSAPAVKNEMGNSEENTKSIDNLEDATSEIYTQSKLRIMFEDDADLNEIDNLDDLSANDVAINDVPNENVNVRVKSEKSSPGNDESDSDEPSKLAFKRSLIENYYKKVRRNCLKHIARDDVAPAGTCSAEGALDESEASASEVHSDSDKWSDDGNSIDEKLLQLSCVVLTPLEHNAQWRKHSRGGSIKCRQISVKRLAAAAAVTDRELMSCRRYILPAARAWLPAGTGASCTGIARDKLEELRGIPPTYKAIRRSLTSQLRLPRTLLSRDFWCSARNVAQLCVCRPAAVHVERLAARPVKRVELTDIDEVRRINSTILTAQVAPIPAQAPGEAGRASSDELIREATSDLPIIEEGGEEREMDTTEPAETDELPSQEDLMKKIKTLVRPSMEAMREAAARLQRERDASTQREEALVASARDSARRLHADIRALFDKGDKSGKRAKACPKVKKVIPPKKMQKLDDDERPLPDALQEWQRQKTLVHKYFTFPARAASKRAKNKPKWDDTRTSCIPNDRPNVKKVIPPKKMPNLDNEQPLPDALQEWQRQKTLVHKYFTFPTRAARERAANAKLKQKDNNDSNDQIDLLTISDSEDLSIIDDVAQKDKADNAAKRQHSNDDSDDSHKRIKLTENVNETDKRIEEHIRYNDDDDRLLIVDEGIRDIDDPIPSHDASPADTQQAQATSPRLTIMPVDSMSNLAETDMSSNVVYVVKSHKKVDVPKDADVIPTSSTVDSIKLPGDASLTRTTPVTTAINAKQPTYYLLQSGRLVEGNPQFKLKSGSLLKSILSKFTSTSSSQNQNTLNTTESVQTPSQPKHRNTYPTTTVTMLRPGPLSQLKLKSGPPLKSILHKSTPTSSSQNDNTINTTESVLTPSKSKYRNTYPTNTVTMSRPGPLSQFKLKSGPPLKSILRKSTLTSSIQNENTTNTTESVQTPSQPKYQNTYPTNTVTMTRPGPLSYKFKIKNQTSKALGSARSNKDTSQQKIVEEIDLTDDTEDNDAAGENKCPRIVNVTSLTQIKQGKNNTPTTSNSNNDSTDSMRKTLPVSATSKDKMLCLEVGPIESRIDTDTRGRTGNETPDTDAGKNEHNVVDAALGLNHNSSLADKQKENAETVCLDSESSNEHEANVDCTTMKKERDADVDASSNDSESGDVDIESLFPLHWKENKSKPSVDKLARAQNRSLLKSSHVQANKATPKTTKQRQPANRRLPKATPQSQKPTDTSQTKNTDNIPIKITSTTTSKDLLKLSPEELARLLEDDNDFEEVVCDAETPRQEKAVEPQNIAPIQIKKEKAWAEEIERSKEGGAKKSTAAGVVVKEEPGVSRSAGATEKEEESPGGPVELLQGISTLSVLRDAAPDVICGDVIPDEEDSYFRSLADLGRAQVDVSVYVDQVSEPEEPILRCDFSEPLWLIGDKYMLLTDESVQSAAPAYITAACIRDLPPYTLLRFPDTSTAHRQLLDLGVKKGRDVMVCGCGGAGSCLLCQSIAGKDGAPAEFIIHKPKFKKPCRACGVDPARERARIYTIKGRAYRQIGDAPLKFVAVDARRTCRVCHDAAHFVARPDALLINDKYYEKLRDQPLMYAPVLSVVQSEAHCSRLARREAELYLLNLRTARRRRLLYRSDAHLSAFDAAVRVAIAKMDREEVDAWFRRKVVKENVG